MKTQTRPMGARDTFAAIRDITDKPARDITNALTAAERTGIGRIGHLRVLHVGYATGAERFDASTGEYQIRA